MIKIDIDLGLKLFGIPLFGIKIENGLVFAKVRFAVTKSNGKRCLYCNGKFHAFVPENRKQSETAEIALLGKKIENGANF